MAEKSTNSPGRFRKSYTMKMKLDVVDWHLNNGEVISVTARKFGVDRKMMREWVKAETVLRNAAAEDRGRRR